MQMNFADSVTARRAN